MKLSVALLCAAMIATACARARGPLIVGESLPIATQSERAVVWVFSADRCLGCTLTEPARTLRRIQHRFGGQLEMVVVAISESRDHDEGLVNSFLRSQRLTARIEMHSMVNHAIQFGFGAPEPTVYLVDAKQIVGIFPPDLDGLIDHVESLIAD